jgi:hypothetical protein
MTVRLTAQDSGSVSSVQVAPWWPQLVDALLAS